MKNKQLLMMVVAAGIGFALYQRSKSGGGVATVANTKSSTSLAGGGWADINESLFDWFGDSPGKVTDQEKREFMAMALPESVTVEDFNKYANGEAFGGGYTQQDMMLIDDVVD